ncbi:MAG: MBOAT family protein [Lachnospiraceae bacterium]|jgi:alginate O-acetyltransferase complex protein AlgI|nr:MBOAT family protein [Lachnospiraceae bacterium]
MLFNSNAFYVFLPIVFLVYWTAPRKYRWGVLFVASYYFYMSWNVKYVALILLTTVVSYVTALLMERTKRKSLRKLYLTGALLISLGVLFFFKYYNFLSNSVTELLQRLAIPVQPHTLELMLPVGISFYTFQTLSYVIDVYRGEVKATRHFGKYATFISFFPQLVAGPIERTRNLLPQIEGEHTFNCEKAIAGAKLIAWGFFKKIAIADTISAYVNLIYDQLPERQGFSLVIATVFFAFQIYCDFSGYSDIAVGVAKLLDIDLMTNFSSPYWASSIREFWSRWHISLSTWFRDYVYIPLGGNRTKPWRHRLNLMLTFLASGLWHGANWTYVLWGGIHGLGQIVEDLFLRGEKKRSRKRTWYGVLLTFTFVCFAWIFFRANTVGDAWYVLTHMFTGIQAPFAYIRDGILAFRGSGAATGSGMATLLQALLGILLLLWYDFASLKRDVWSSLGKLWLPLRYLLYFALLFVILYSRQLGEYEFVYFQF